MDRAMVVLILVVLGMVLAGYMAKRLGLFFEKAGEFLEGVVAVLVVLAVIVVLLTPKVIGDKEVDTSIEKIGKIKKELLAKAPKNGR
jgi:hypothetical protein